WQPTAMTGYPEQCCQHPRKKLYPVDRNIYVRSFSKAVPRISVIRQIPLLREIPSKCPISSTQAYLVACGGN
ncbi:hypothetical protein, partial [Yersinia pseudotuberculosis]|uniref:hypothetical protein n=1 Tax=Yersinia pseudotuberculosis TaxID=633 RepID=UPI001C626D58